MPKIITKTLTAANAAIICASQTPGAAGAMTLVSSPVTLDTQRRVLITCAGNNSGVTFTIIGTRQTGQTITEVVQGSNASTTSSVNDFYTITSVAISAASTGAVTVGTSTIGSTDWANLNNRAAGFYFGVVATVTGTVNYSIEFTNSRVQANLSGLLPTVSTVNVVQSSITAATASATLGTTTPWAYWRLTINSGVGSVTAEAEQTYTFY